MSSRWPDKIVIGLTGNIATGKSVVRRMLESMDAFGIDADGLAHRAMSPGAPAYQPIIDTFGKWVLDARGEIDRNKLGNVVFSDPDALAKLEQITHPIIGGALDLLLKRAKQKVVVIEAIKLIEGGLAADCDSVWVVDASESLQVSRLMEHRKLSEAAARLRIASQGPQGEKLAKADVVIRNDGSYESTFNQVQKHLVEIAGEPAPAPVEEAKPAPAPAPAPSAPVAAPAPTPAVPPVPVAADAAITIKRGGPKDAEAIAGFINQQRGESLSRTDVMVRFGQKAYVLAMVGDQFVGLCGYLVENLIARVDEIILAPNAPVKPTIDKLVENVESAANGLQCEISLIFLFNDTSESIQQAVKIRGYEPQTIEQLRIPDWREAAQESQPPDTFMLTKRLRADRVLKAI